MSYSEVRSYLTNKDIPKLFTSLMAGLMYNRPEDHIKYLQSCLEQAQNGNVGKFQWNTFIEPKRPKSRELPPLPNRRPSSELANPTATPLPPINSHHFHEEADDGKARYPDVSFSLYHVHENVRPPSAGFKSVAVFVVGGIDEDSRRLCREFVDETEHTAQHVSVSGLMANRMLVEGFTSLDSVPACALVEEIQRSIAKENSDVLLVSGFPRHEKDAVEWESWDLPLPDVFYLDDAQFADKLREKVEAGEITEVEKEKLVNKNNNILSFLEYLSNKYPELVHRGDDVDRLKEIVQNAIDLQDKEVKEPAKTIQSPVTEEEEPNFDYTPLKEAQLPIICVVGVPGAGKSSQSASAGHKYDMTRLSLKELVEKEKNGASERAQLLSDTDPDLLDADLATDMLKEAMFQCYTTAKGFILDGFPQSVEQGQKMEEDVGEFKAILNLQVTTQVAVNRLVKKLIDDGADADEAEALCKIENERAEERVRKVTDHFHHKVITVSSNASAAEVFENVSHVLEEVLEIPEEPAEAVEPECVKEEVRMEEASAPPMEEISIEDEIQGPEEDKVEEESPKDDLDEEMHREIENLIDETSLIADDTEAENIPLDSEVVSESVDVPKEAADEIEIQETQEDESEKVEEKLEDIQALETECFSEVIESEEVNGVQGEEEVLAEDEALDLGEPHREEEVEGSDDPVQEIGSENEIKDAIVEGCDDSKVEEETKDDSAEVDDVISEACISGSIEEIKPVLEVFRDGPKSTTD